MTNQTELEDFAGHLGTTIRNLPKPDVRGSRFVYDASTTKTIATEWVPPSGYVLDGWEVIAIGAGGGTKPAAPSSYGPGAGGRRVRRYVRRTDLDTAATTILISVGAGIAGEAGGASSFAGPLCYAHGGQLALGPKNALHPDLAGVVAFMAYASNATYIGIQEGDAGQGSPTGRAAGGGAFSVGGADTVPVVNKGHAAWPHPNALGTQGTTPTSGSLSQNTNVFANNGNPVATVGATGHDGIADGGGGGGNSCTVIYYAAYYYDSDGDGSNESYYPGGTGYSGSPGQGGFPGGGAGGSGSGATSTTQRGGHGRVIVYPWFRKVVA